MKTICGTPYVNLEPYIDMAGFDSLHDQIALAIARNADHIETSYAPQVTLLNQNLRSFFELREDYRTRYQDVLTNQRQLDWYAKLSSCVTLGLQLKLRQPTVPFPDNYKFKHTKAVFQETSVSEHFGFLYDWIDQQNIFSDYGRIIFFINEPGQQTIVHSDYQDDTQPNRDQFIWLTGHNAKQIVIHDRISRKSYHCPYRATIFNNVDYHSSRGHPDYTSWSLRIDGVFQPEWAERAGLKNYFNL